MMKLTCFTQTFDEAHRAASPEHIYFENGQPDQEKSRKNVPKGQFLAKISDLNTGICGLGRHRSAAISAPKSHAIAFLTP